MLAWRQMHSRTRGTLSISPTSVLLLVEIFAVYWALGLCKAKDRFPPSKKKIELTTMTTAAECRWQRMLCDYAAAWLKLWQVAVVAVPFPAPPGHPATLPPCHRFAPMPLRLSLTGWPCGLSVWPGLWPQQRRNQIFSKRALASDSNFSIVRYVCVCVCVWNAVPFAFLPRGMLAK